MSLFGPSRRWLIPEVVQTSSLDCGPAALKSLLEGFGISVSYGRLREACQTDIDGTSIDALEEVARKIGLDIEQQMVPIDHIFLRESRSLPAIVVIRLPSGLTHFVVAWNRLFDRGRPDSGGFIQVMDPGEGRQWRPVRGLIRDLFVHSMPVPAEAWREHTSTERFLDPLRRHLRAVGVRANGDALVQDALGDPSWRSIAALDASVRLVGSLCDASALDRGREAVRVLQNFFEQARAQADVVERPEAASAEPGALLAVPDRFWTVRPHSPDEEGTEQVALRGAVLLSVSGLLPHAPVSGRRPATPRASGAPEPARHEPPPDLPPEIAAALAEKPPEPARDLVRMLREDGVLAPAVLLAALTVAALAALGESVLFRALFDISRWIGHGPQRLGALAAFVLFLGAVLALEVPLQLGLQRVGRHLEARLRVAFLEKIPKLGDRYFQSRPRYDMTERSHSVQQLRALPFLAGAFARAVCGLVVTTAGIALVAPEIALPAALAAFASVIIPVLAQRPLGELDLRFRAHAGALGRFYLDALQGLVAVRTHGADRAVRREHEALLVDWARAGVNLQRLSVLLEALEGVAGLGLSAALLFGPFSRGDHAGNVLLLAYWALSIPALGAEVAVLARQYPDHRNVVLRLFEPLGALEDQSALAAMDLPQRAAPSRGVEVVFEGVTARASGHTVLDDISLTIDPGAHVAIVGSSGAGKSSLVGVLLGWLVPAAGAVRVDGEALEGARLAQLRRETAWVDPAIQLWNRSLLDNLRYGTSLDAGSDFGEVIRMADLRGVLERLPDALQSELGEGGALVSGGEGQRVRLGRALLRSDARLVILDEPFRGLDRERRRELLARARERWKGATLLCVTHDVRETLGFERVLVVENGRVIEDDFPRYLAENTTSRYRALLDAEDSVREGLWSAAAWRRVRMEGGKLVERSAPATTPNPLPRAGGGGARAEVSQSASVPPPERPT